jgi:Lrp/AsnC family leucine-responsive transcriptional regulator
MKQIDLDEFDIRILEIVQQDSRLSSEVIAEKVCLSPSAVQRRLKRLRKSGVIESEIAIISPEAIGHRLIVIVEVTLENEQLNTVETFKRLMQNAPEVMQCYYVTGASDFFIIMTAETMQDYETFARQFFLESPYIKRYQTSIVVQKVKSGFTIPLKLK